MRTPWVLKSIVLRGVLTTLGVHTRHLDGHLIYLVKKFDMFGVAGFVQGPDVQGQ
jgi:hypothetical protein